MHGHAFTSSLMAVTIAISLFVTGCPPTGSRPCDTDQDCPEGRCRFGACGPICEEDQDCGSRQICKDGACVARPECQSNQDCASGFACSNGSCLCTNDQACALNQSCVDGACVARQGCRANEECPSGQRCEVTQGLCIPPCASPSDCAPGVDPRVALALYACVQGTCFRHCVNDLTCGQGLICADGLCNAAECATMTDCPSGQYCSSANFGRCLAYQTCSSTSQCAPNYECKAFDAQTCPPGFPCQTKICQELPRCLVDQDCFGGLPGQPQTAAYCQDYHCQPTSKCTSVSNCTAGQACIGQLCVPSGCRGHADCDVGDACVAGTCRTQPAPVDISALSITPLAAHVPVGGTVQLKLVGYQLDGSSFPMNSATFEVVDESGQPSSAATVTNTGLVTGVSAAKVTVKASVPGAAVNPVSATVFVHAQLASGRRVTVVDATTMQPLSGAAVLGCDAPPYGAPCPSPVEVTTNAMGEALFPTFDGFEGHYSIAVPGVRADGLPAWERVSFSHADAYDLFVPVWPNPVRAAAGFNGTVSFNQVHSDGNYWVGFAALSAADPSDLDLQQLLGEPFFVSLQGVPQKVPVPGSVVLYTSPGLGIADPVKEKSLGLGQPGRRNATAFAGRTTIDQLLTVRSTDFLAYSGAFDFALLPFFSYASRPRVPDVTDVDGDGLCMNAQTCPQGPETVPDYFNFTPLAFTPKYPQDRRTEVVIPDLPNEFDTAIVAAVESAPESGLTPMGFTSRTARPPTSTGERPVDPVLMRSGAPLGGVEVGQPGLWVIASQAQSLTTGGGAASGRISTGPLLPTRAVIPPFLPGVAGATWVPQTRTFSPAQPGWNAAVSAGGELARVEWLGTQTRHRVYFAASGSQTSVDVPDAPQAGGLDPVTEANATLRVTLLDLRAGVTAKDAVGLGGEGLGVPSLIMDGYTRWQSQ